MVFGAAGPRFRFAREPFPLFRLFGIQLTASWGWLVLVALLAFVASSTFEGDTALQGMEPILFAALVVLATLLAVASLYGHELAHALTARYFGIPVRTINLFLLGGVAHIARDASTPGQELLVAASGPVASLAMGLIGLALWAGFAGGLSSFIAAIGVWLALLNLPLAFLNLAPAYPLDGGRALRAVLWYAGQDQRWATIVASRAGQIGAAGLLFAGLYTFFGSSASAVGGVWLVLIAWYMYAGAISAQRLARMTDVLKDVDVAAVMQRPIRRVNGALSLHEFARDYVVPDGTPEIGGQLVPDALRTYGVESSGQIVGLIGAQELRRVDGARWEAVTVETAMIDLAQSRTLDPSMPAARAMAVLLEEGRDQLPVVAQGELLGLLSRLDLARAAEKRSR